METKLQKLMRELRAEDRRREDERQAALREKRRIEDAKRAEIHRQAATRRAAFSAPYGTTTAPAADPAPFYQAPAIDAPAADPAPSYSGGGGSFDGGGASGDW